MQSALSVWSDSMNNCLNKEELSILFVEELTCNDEMYIKVSWMEHTVHILWK